MLVATQASHGPRVPESGVIRLSGVTKSFMSRGVAGPPVVRDVSLGIPPGCLYGLIGPGASGKSVLLKLIVGLLRPDRGTIEVEGQDVTRMNELDLQTLRLRFGTSPWPTTSPSPCGEPPRSRRQRSTRR